MKPMPITPQQLRQLLRVTTKAAKTGAEVFRRAIPIVSALAEAVRVIRRNIK